jgi:hypothetical protein
LALGDGQSHPRTTGLGDGVILGLEPDFP